MKIDRLSAAAEIVAAFSVVVSLVYVAAEVRQNTRALDSATFQAVSSDVRDLAAVLPYDVRGKIRNGEPLTAGERSQYAVYTYIALLLYESWWQQWQLGTLDTEVFDAYITGMSGTMSDSVARAFWRTSQAGGSLTFLPGFAEVVEQFLADNPLP
jgi:hypothetical protein